MTGRHGRPDAGTGEAYPAPDAALLAAARAGKPEALTELFHRYGQQMLDVAYQVTGSTHDAEDVVQDLFVGLPEALRAYSGRGALDAWLRRLATRTSLVWLRQERRRSVRYERLAAEVDGQVRPAAVETRLTLERALARMPEELRSVYMLKEVEGYGHADIAEVLGISRTASENRLHRARLFLRDRLKGKL